MILDTYPTVYTPREDSQLLASEVKKIAKGKRVLDMGCGSGIVAISAALADAKEVLACDLNPAAVRNTEENAAANKVLVRVFLSNLFEAVHPEDKFDLIAFNAPYLPVTIPTDIQWSGGKKLIDQFLEQAKQHLNKDGQILFVFSSLTGMENVETVAEQTMPDGEKLFIGRF